MTKFTKELKIFHIFLEISHNVILKLNMGVKRQPDTPPFSKSLATPLV